MQFSSLVLADDAPEGSPKYLSDQAWEVNLRKQNFQDREIIAGAEQNILQIKAPFRAEDAAIVPVSVHTKIPQTEDRYIKKIHVYIDNNPLPLVGQFEFTPDSGKADIAFRVRVNASSYIRAIAELSTGELYMSKSFVQAKGACSAPPPASMAESVKSLGKMKMKVVGLVKMGKPNLMQVKIRHPNLTGLAPLKAGSSIIPPAFYVDTFEVVYNDKPIVKATLTYAISMDPTLRFYFLPEKEGELIVTGTDTEAGKFSSTHMINVWKPATS
ncbi:MAG: quinoprotein dehydrogenase-associated SoxYZ-like carrier [Gammaproteobacteria bacterium]|nr:MAG: quinoprotein dehydrogenase-associated SoxYZ-like carrier [Gammaproteobacteria bacterium]